jgi:hypothetical protein
MAKDERLQHLRSVLILVAILATLAFLLTRCPANRDGMPGQLAQAMAETTSAARSAALALDMWTQHRSTAELTAVQLTDARTEIVKAYEGIAELRAEDPVDIGRQRMLTESMTRIIGQLNAVVATVRQVSAEPAAERTRAELLAAADALESGYR